MARKKRGSGCSDLAISLLVVAALLYALALELGKAVVPYVKYAIFFARPPRLTPIIQGRSGGLYCHAFGDSPPPLSPASTIIAPQGAGSLYVVW